MHLSPIPDPNTCPRVQNARRCFSGSYNLIYLAGELGEEITSTRPAVYYTQLSTQTLTISEIHEIKRFQILSSLIISLLRPAAVLIYSFLLFSCSEIT